MKTTIYIVTTIVIITTLFHGCEISAPEKPGPKTLAIDETADPETGPAESVDPTPEPTAQDENYIEVEGILEDSRAGCACEDECYYIIITADNGETYILANELDEWGNPEDEIYFEGYCGNMVVRVLYVARHFIYGECV